MANIKGQVKRNRQNETRRLRNKGVRSELKTRVKDANEAVDANAEDAPEQGAPRPEAPRQGRLQGPHPQEPGGPSHLAAHEASDEVGLSLPQPRPDRALRPQSRTTSTSSTASPGMARAPFRSRSARARWSKAWRRPSVPSARACLSR